MWISTYSLLNAKPNLIFCAVIKSDLFTKILYVPWHLTRQFVCPSIFTAYSPCIHSSELPLNVSTNFHGVMPHSWLRLLLSLHLSFVSPTSIDPCHQPSITLCGYASVCCVDSKGFLWKKLLHYLTITESYCMCIVLIIALINSKSSHNVTATVYVERSTKTIKSFSLVPRNILLKTQKVRCCSPAQCLNLCKGNSIVLCKIK